MSKDAKNVPALRFKGYSDAWEKRKVSDYLCESRIPGSNGLKAKKLTVKLWGKGVVPKNETYSGSIKTKYYVRSANQLIYGKLDFLHAAFGIVPQSLDGWESTIDSPAFDVNTSIGNAAFLLALFLKPNFYLREGIRANGSRKAKRIHEDTFLSMSISAPQRKEQNQIAMVLDKTEFLIAATQHKIDALEQAKKALLQRLFDQSWRFKGYSDPWEKRKLGDILNYEQPTPYIVRSENYQNSFPTPVLTAGKSLLLGYTNETNGIKSASKSSPVIIFDDFTTSSHLIDFPFKIKSSAMKILSPSNNDSDIYFSFGLLSSINYVSKNHERHWISQFSNFRVQVPSVHEQACVSRVLLNVTDLIAATQSRLSSLELLKKALLQDLFI
ncbi:restriction endonuclease subunit S [Lacticaseibacillus paracasei]|uniref:restriction endonuclease subunit S n=1 Tax=Lacticaseibacillus paracasei TaxID=1597 RepID=UPI000CD2A3D8|nr:restriction endonuclease subunit S [Lacticaseibacillus paracasei]